MNPFEEHDLNQGEYEQICAYPVNGKAGNNILYPVDQYGKQTPATQTYPAVISPFASKDYLSGAGFVAKMIAQAIVRKEVLQPGTVFRTGHLLQATAVGGASRMCQIQDVIDTFTEFRLELWDRNEGA